MPPSDRQKARWQGEVTEGALAAVEATRAAMAAAVDMSSGSWSATTLFDPAWWMGSVDRFIIPKLERVGAATIVAAGAEWGLREVVESDEWLPAVSDIIVGQQTILHAYSDTIAERVVVLADRGNAESWEPDRMAEALGVALEYDGLVAAAGPVSNGLATGIGETESHTLIESSPLTLWSIAGLEGQKTWVCSFQRSRLNHIKADGQTVPANEPFVLADDALADYPGDWTLPGGERVSCLCYMLLTPTTG